MAKKNKITCAICKDTKLPSDVLPFELVRETTIAIIKKKFPNLSLHGHICFQDLNHFRAEYIKNILEQERGEISQIDKDVIESLRKHEILTKNINKQFEGKLKLGEKLADKVAEVGGSWKFILFFFFFLIVWILINVYVISQKPFDPYPFILLNLVLSCLAAIQAPIIMMSQNRQEAKDRIRSEEDYKTNLKSELMIRHVNSKVDQLISNQWQRLLEIQKMQIELMEESLKRK